MPPQKTQPAQVITDGDRLAVVEGLLRHIMDELHDQNKALAKLERLADEAAPLLESPAAKWFAQRRVLKHPRAAPGGQ